MPDNLHKVNFKDSANHGVDFLTITPLLLQAAIELLVLCIDATENLLRKEESGDVVFAKPLEALSKTALGPQRFFYGTSHPRFAGNTRIEHGTIAMLPALGSAGTNCSGGERHHLAYSPCSALRHCADVLYPAHASLKSFCLCNPASTMLGADRIHSSIIVTSSQSAQRRRSSIIQLKYISPIQA
jgi:hypothetical protein